LGKCTAAKECNYSKPELTSVQDLYYNFGGNFWNNNSGWLDGGTHHCQWFGITCNEDGLVANIRLRNNNLVSLRKEELFQVCSFKELKVLDLAGNQLDEPMIRGSLPTFPRLEHIDISDNLFTGHADMTFSSATSYVNFSNNQFTSSSFKRFKAAYENLNDVYLSNNNIRQDSSKMFYNIPPNIKELLLSSNSIYGTLPIFLLERLKQIVMANNNIVGTFPDFPDSAPLLRELDL
jgi:hypothetical protein